MFGWLLASGVQRSAGKEVTRKHFASHPSRETPLLGGGSIPVWVTSLRSGFLRRLSAVALAKADLTARIELRLATHSFHEHSQTAPAGESGSVAAVRLNRFPSNAMPSGKNAAAVAPVTERRLTHRSEARGRMRSAKARIRRGMDPLPSGEGG